MTQTEITTQNWLDAAIQSIEETATCALGCDGVKIIKTSNEFPSDLAGSFIGLMGSRVSIQLGITATNETCQLLAKALFGMDSDDEELPPADVADAVGEIANIMIGVVKGIMSEKESNMQIGLPIFFEGNITLTDKQEVAVAEIQLDSLNTHIVVITPSVGETKGDV